MTFAFFFVEYPPRSRPSAEHHLASGDHRKGETRTRKAQAETTLQTKETRSERTRTEAQRHIDSFREKDLRKHSTTPLERYCVSMVHCVRSQSSSFRCLVERKRYHVPFIAVESVQHVDLHGQCLLAKVTSREIERAATTRFDRTFLGSVSKIAIRRSSTKSRK